MPGEISVGPPVLTINEGTTFMVTDQHGAIDPHSEQGVFSGDTRFVSDYRLCISGQPWQLLASAPIQHDTAQLQFMSPRVATEAGEIEADAIGLTILRRVRGGIHEDLDIRSYASHPVHFQLDIDVRSDFADIHEVRGHQFIRRGHISTQWDTSVCALISTYQNGDFERTLAYRLSQTSSRPDLANSRIVCDVALAPGAGWHACADYLLLENAPSASAIRAACDAHQHVQRAEWDQPQREWLSRVTQFTTANDDVARTLLRSVEDLGALRIHDADLPDDAWVPAAGVPWYVALFGRDSLIVSLQTLPVEIGFARGTLHKLGALQATQMDDWRDAEPGKILHELRLGELAQHDTLPYTPYYGTADATILYLILLHATWKWTGDLELLRHYREAAVGCLDWIDRFGDLDGDGFQEYRTRSRAGYENVGWKDSEDAVVYPDGGLVPQPKALVELQGYVFDAKLRMVEVFSALGEPARAAELRRQAAELQQRFEDAFWMPEHGFYAFALDAEKRQVASIASDVGHCLWSGIVGADRAERVVQRLLADDLWSGWGIRTLSAQHPGYNPFSYHRGSVWPHDNGLIALGCKRYGAVAAVHRLAEAIFSAASQFQRFRLPELYAGLPRDQNRFPAPYVRASIPQAWAAGSVFHLLQALLGLRADAPHGRLLVDPTLPDWLPDLELSNLLVAHRRLTVRFWREQRHTRWAVVAQPGSGPEIQVVHESWEPWRRAA